MKGVIGFEKGENLNPRYIESFEILWTIREVAYKLALPSSFSSIHLFFHVSMFWPYILNKSNVLHWHSIQLDERVSYVEELVSIHFS